MSKNKSLGSELSVSLTSKTNYPEQLEKFQTNSLDENHSTDGGFAAVAARLKREVNTKATIATTVRLPEDSDLALKAACAQFQKSKADLMKVCVEEFLKANNFLKNTQI